MEADKAPPFYPAFFSEDDKTLGGYSDAWDSDHEILLASLDNPRPNPPHFVWIL